MRSLIVAMNKTPRILSIQSTVSHGYVGNKAATFPLQCMGFDVCAINTVSLSNHPDYPNSFKGQFLSADEMRNTVQGLEGNGLLTHDIVMNGYTRNIDVLRTIKDTVQKVKLNNPNAIYICDPVLGDNDRFYVPEELLDVYKKELLPIADVITPNYFEVEVLTGMKVTTVEEAVKASAILHDLGVKIVIMTGQRLSDSGPVTAAGSEAQCETGAGSGSGARKQQSVLLSTRRAAGGGHSILRVDVPYIPGYYYGCGDLFAALCANGVYWAGHLSDRVLTTARSGDAPDSQTKTREDVAMQCLAQMLDHSAWAMTHIIKATQCKGSKELLIVESIDIYRAIYADWVRIVRSKDVHGKVITSTSTATATASSQGSGLILSSSSNATDIAETVAQTLEHIKPAHVAHNNKIIGAIFDLDGTLTKPGLINFDAMWERTKLSRSNGSILTQIRLMTDPVAKEEAMRIIEEEEQIGHDTLEIRDELGHFLERLQRSRVRIAISTLNSQEGLERFYAKAGLSASAFYPAYHRDSLQGVHKPDPAVAVSIMNVWEAGLHSRLTNSGSVTSAVIDTPKSSDESSSTVENAAASSTYGDVWFVGDSVDDMRCGKGAGCKTCLLRTPFNGNVLTENAHLVDLSVNSLNEWLDHMEV
jgi:pyridoxine kinase